MPRVSIRWWLALTFALIAAITALAVAQMSTHRANEALRDRAREIAAGNAVAAALAIRKATPRGDLERTLPAIAERWRLTLFVFDAERRLLARSGPPTLDVRSSPLIDEGLRKALGERRFVSGPRNAETWIIALPLHTGNAAAVVALASRPDVTAQLGIVRDRIGDAALIAVLVGAAAGLVIATMISLRLRRIAAAAAAIERGSFDGSVRPRFRDELGDLATTVDRMRVRLRHSFASLQSERDRLQHVLEQLHEGVVSVQPDLTIQFANRAAARVLKAQAREGEELPDPWSETSLRRIAAGLFSPGSTLVRAVGSDAEDRAYAIVGIPPQPGAKTAVLVFSDISERERREHAEREFVTNAAHELRTPLAALRSAVEALNAGARDDPESRDRFLALIERQVERLGRLARALLVLARTQTLQEPLRLEPVELRPLLEDVAAATRPPDGVSVQVTCPQRLRVLAQRDLAEQLLSNVASNAAKHTACGRILLAARAVGGHSVAIEVIDTGSGIPQGDQERIFDRFFTGDRGSGEGFGLGLAIAREAVRALGGAIEIDSLPGAGTTVRVTLATGGGRAA